MSITLYCHHGWSYDQTFWAPLLAQLPHVTPLLIDEGYYGAPSFPPPPSTPYWAVGHSAGVMALLGQELPQCLGLIAINGFAQFHESDDFPQGIPSRMIARMQRRLTTQPNDVLHSFRQSCGDHSPLPNAPLQSDRLYAGLERLCHDNHRPFLDRWNGRLYSLAGADDPLSPARAGLPAPAQTTTRQGGHLLPLTDPAFCASFIQTIINSP